MSKVPTGLLLTHICRSQMADVPICLGDNPHEAGAASGQLECLDAGQAVPVHVHGEDGLGGVAAQHGRTEADFTPVEVRAVVISLPPPNGKERGTLPRRAWKRRATRRTTTLSEPATRTDGLIIPTGMRRTTRRQKYCFCCS